MFFFFRVKEKTGATIEETGWQEKEQGNNKREKKRKKCKKNRYAHWFTAAANAAVNAVAQKCCPPHVLNKVIPSTNCPIKKKKKPNAKKSSVASYLTEMLQDIIKTELEKNMIK